MDEHGAHHLLIARGLIRPNGRPWASDGEIPAFNAFADPAGTDSLGEILAERLSRFLATTVLVWDGSDESVLAHVVARHLGVKWARAFDDGGRLRYEGALDRGSSVVLLDDAYRNSQRIRGLHALARLSEANVVAAAALVTSQALASAAQELGIPVVVASGE
jgi:hypothetical protein